MAPTSAGAGDHDLARRCLEDAVDRFERAGSSFNAGKARVDLARSLVAQGSATARSRRNSWSASTPCTGTSRTSLGSSASPRAPAAVAFLVGGAAAEQGKHVVMFLTKEAVRLGLRGHAEAIACDGCPPLARLFQR